MKYNNAVGEKKTRNLNTYIYRNESLEFRPRNIYVYVGTCKINKNNVIREEKLCRHNYILFIIILHDIINVVDSTQAKKM